MKLIFTRYPIDYFICLFYSILLLPFIFFDINEIIRVIISLPFILFIPGYLILSCLFPKNKINGGLDFVEKIAFSFGISIALIPFIGMGLYYLPFGLKLQPVLLSIFFIIFVSGIVAIFIWYKTPIQKRFVISFFSNSSNSKTSIDRFLLMILLIIIIIAVIIAIFVVISPKKQETLTEFYILGSSGKAEDYPHNLAIGQYTNVTLGLINHEYKTINYTIEVWLINQTIIYNNMTHTNVTLYNQMWFLDKIIVKLNHFTKNTDIIWQPQWEYLYKFNINKTGQYNLVFLLFTNPTPEYNRTQNYQNIAALKIQSAYESIYIWLNINKNKYQ